MKKRAGVGGKISLSSSGSFSVRYVIHDGEAEGFSPYPLVCVALCHEEANGKCRGQKIINER